MQINEGESKMNKNKDRIAGVDTSNMAGIYEIMAKTMPHNQIYRELITNSLTKKPFPLNKLVYCPQGL